jgi:hypothetical protein
MHTWKNALLSLTAVLVLAVSLVAARTNDAKAVPGPDNVIVTNGADRPIPVTALGTTIVGGTVAISNLPATQQVAGTINVGNLPATQQVTGSVAVSNLPAVQQVAGEVRVAQPALVHGSGSITLSSIWTQRYLMVPADAVITDVRLERYPIAGSDASCEVWLAQTVDGGFGSATFFRPSATTPVVELHLNSGFGPSADTSDRGFFMNADCLVRVFWTGYRL